MPPFQKPKSHGRTISFCDSKEKSTITLFFKGVSSYFVLQFCHSIFSLLKIIVQCHKKDSSYMYNLSTSKNYTSLSFLAIVQIFHEYQFWKIQNWVSGFALMRKSLIVLYALKVLTTKIREGSSHVSHFKKKSLSVWDPTSSSSLRPKGVSLTH